jgi:hypothetical protein
MLTLSNRCIYVALCSAAQLVASIGQKADPAAQSLGFTVYFWRQASINGSGGSDETKCKNCEEKTHHSPWECTRARLWAKLAPNVRNRKVLRASGKKGLPLNNAAPFA